MQSVRFRIWTCVAVSISCDANHYTTGTSFKTCLLMFTSLVALGGFHLLLSTQLTADLTHPLLNIYTKTPCCIETVTNMLWIINALLFLIDCEQTHFENSFLNDKCSCKMVNTLPSDIFNSSAISRNFNVRSAKTSLWNFLLFSTTTAEFGRPERSESFVSVQLCLKSAYHLLTVVSDGAEF